MCGPTCGRVDVMTLPDPFAARYGRPTGQPAALGALVPGAPVPPGHGALLISRPPFPTLWDANIKVRISWSEVALAAGEWLIPVIPGRHEVSFHATDGSLLAATTVAVVDGGSVRLNVQLGGLPYGITDQYGRQIAHRRRPKYGLVLAILLLGVAALMIGIRAVAEAFG